MKTIHLSGELAERFTPTLTAEVHTLKDVLDCLSANYPDFRPYLIEGVYMGESWHLRYGEDYMSEDDVLNGMPIGSRDVYIDPVMQGSDRNLISIGIGIVAIAAGVFTGGIGFLGISAAGAILLGGTMVVSGVLGMLSESAMKQTDEENDEKASVFFSGGENIEKQGGILPVVYGDKVLCASTVLSFSLRTYTELSSDEE